MLSPQIQPVVVARHLWPWRGSVIVHTVQEMSHMPLDTPSGDR